MQLSKLQKIEINAYCGVWLACLLFALWSFIQDATANFYILDPRDFSKGWLILARNKDISDIEWHVFTDTFKKYWVMIAFQLLCTSLLSKFSKMVLSIFYAIYSTLCLSIILGWKATLVYILYILLIYIIHTSGRKNVCYFLTISVLFVTNSFSGKKLFVTSGNQLYLYEVGSAWLIARCLSFTIDRINAYRHSYIGLTDFMCVMSYCFYLPAFFTGPLLCYDEFVRQMSSKNQSHQQLSLAFKRILYYIFWYFVLEFLLHYVYASSIQFYPQIVATFGSWSLCGLGYALPFIFYLKYFVIYGLAGSIASFEQFEFPPPPKCISCVHLCSELYRYFDRGLYIWILRYIYIPLVRGDRRVFRKMYAMMIVFTFICIWHGMDKAVCMWSFLNFVLIASEIILSSVFPSVMHKDFISRKKRFHALIATPQFVIMCLSSTFFLSNWDIGVLIFQKVLCGGLIPLLPMAAIMYCGCHASVNKELLMRNSIKLKIFCK